MSNDHARRRRLVRAVAVLVVFAACVLLFLWYVGVFGGNVRVVVAGRVYRSAELTGDKLDEVLKADHIRTELNLRGGQLSDSWYRSERDVCRRDGVRHVDTPFSAIKLPPPATLHAILATFDKKTNYPVLFHCQGGADRSGLVGTIYLNVYQHVPIDEAVHRELTWRYGHFGFTRTGAMDRFFALYREYGKGMNLRDWIDRRYPSVYAKQPADLKIPPKNVQQPTVQLPTQRR